jgi:hypothetical protein
LSSSLGHSTVSPALVPLLRRIPYSRPDDHLSPIDRLLDRALDRSSARATSAPFLAHLAAPERGACAVVLYGSCLWSEVRGPTSQPDFFVLVDSLRAWHCGILPSLLNAVLPPSIYRLRAAGLEAKVSVLSTAQLARHCSSAAPDLHHLGRFSKRIALVWSRDAEARARVVSAQRAALETLAPLALARCPSTVQLDEFMQTLLRLSYEAEVRIVEHGKAAALFEIEREHYRAIGRELLVGLGAEPSGALHYRVARGRAARPIEVERRLRRSRRRAVLRWPKYLLTYDGWLDYLLAKLARAGSPVSLTPRQRRYPLILALPVLWRLARAKRLR